MFLGIQGQNRRKMYSQKWPNMGGESCTVLRLRLMRKLAMPHTGFNGINVFLLSWRRKKNVADLPFFVEEISHKSTFHINQYVSL